MPGTSPGIIHTDSQRNTGDREWPSSGHLGISTSASCTAHLRHLLHSLAVPAQQHWPASTLKDLDAAMQTYLIPPGFYNLRSPFLGFPWSLRAILHLTPPGLPIHTMLSFEEPPRHSENTAEYCGHHGMYTHSLSHKYLPRVWGRI